MGKDGVLRGVGLNGRGWELAGWGNAVGTGEGGGQLIGEFASSGYRHCLVERTGCCLSDLWISSLGVKDTRFREPTHGGAWRSSFIELINLLMNI